MATVSGSLSSRDKYLFSNLKMLGNEKATLRFHKGDLQIDEWKRLSFPFGWTYDIFSDDACEVLSHMLKRACEIKNYSLNETDADYAKLKEIQDATRNVWVWMNAQISRVQKDVEFAKSEAKHGKASQLENKINKYSQLLAKNPEKIPAAAEPELKPEVKLPPPAVFLEDFATYKAKKSRPRKNSETARTQVVEKAKIVNAAEKTTFKKIGPEINELSLGISLRTLHHVEGVKLQLAVDSPKAQEPVKIAPAITVKKPKEKNPEHAVGVVEGPLTEKAYKIREEQKKKYNPKELSRTISLQLGNTLKELFGEDDNRENRRKSIQVHAWQIEEVSGSAIESTGSSIIARPVNQPGSEQPPVDVDLRKFLLIRRSRIKDEA